MIQPSFHIVNEQKTTQQEAIVNLLIIYHPAQLMLLWYDQTTPDFEKFAVYDLPTAKDSDAVSQLRQILDQELEGRQAIVSLIYNITESTLLPASFYDMDIAQALMSVVAGDASRQLVLSEKVTGEDIYNSYRVPVAVHKLFQEKLKSGVFWHIDSKWIGLVKQSEQQDIETFQLIFNPESFKVGYVKKGIPQLFQTYIYQTPEDVAFQLLTIVRELSIDTEQLHLVVAGMITEDSSLYKEIEKYFLHVSLQNYDPALWSSPVLNEWPAQYFSNLLQLALCV